MDRSELPVSKRLYFSVTIFLGFMLSGCAVNTGQLPFGVGALAQAQMHSVQLRNGKHLSLYKNMSDMLSLKMEGRDFVPLWVVANNARFVPVGQSQGVQHFAVEYRSATCALGHQLVSVSGEQLLFRQIGDCRSPLVVRNLGGEVQVSVGSGVYYLNGAAVNYSANTTKPVVAPAKGVGAARHSVPVANKPTPRLFDNVQSRRVRDVQAQGPIDVDLRDF